MCGIWAYLSKHKEIPVPKLFAAFQETIMRGPDRSEFVEIRDFIDVFLGFHRLSIMDPTTNGDQPFRLELGNGERSIYCMCNGEIYNFHELKEQFGIVTKSRSDCEILPHMYAQMGFADMVKRLDGEFAITVLDINHRTDKMTLSVARDPFGVRPLFVGYGRGSFALCSEAKGLVDIMDNVVVFPPGNTMTIDIQKDGDLLPVLEPYYSYDYLVNYQNCEVDVIKEQVKELLTDAVRRRLESDRPLGCLLSGGLDSSLVSSIAAKILREQGKILNTFSIGIPGSTDKKYAQMVADFIGSNHTHVKFTEEEFLEAIPAVVTATETFDITTIRASVGQYLISRWIMENTDVRVLLIGDGSDEVCAGYMYFFNAPTPMASHNENRKLLQEIHLYDVLRADRGIAENGLEARVPFLAKSFVDFYMSISPELRMAGYEGRMEKWLLRESFNDGRYLPDEVLFRRKEAFSDGVSGTEKSWFEIVQERANTMFTDKEFKKEQAKYTHCPPLNKEALYFRKMFEEKYGANETAQYLIPHFWLPSWCGDDITEPSARILDVYETDTATVES